MTNTVHVITDLGPTDGPGLVVNAEMLGWDPIAARRRAATAAWAQKVDERAAQTIADEMPRHKNNPCYPTSVTFGGINL